jgi:hypothetical protein
MLSGEFFGRSFFRASIMSHTLRLVFGESRQIIPLSFGFASSPFVE